jgi:hypothetical protein
MPSWDGRPPFFSTEILAEHDRRSPIPLARASGTAIDVQAREIRWLAWHLLCREVHPHLTLELLIAFNSARAMPPLEQAEVESIFTACARLKIKDRNRR